MKLVILFFTAYLLGAIPTAFLVAKKSKGIDIREYGSGNVGATNALRVLGKPLGYFVFVVDFLKGLTAVVAGGYLYSGGFQSTPFVSLLIGVCAVLGHIFTPFLGFKGGKGIATGAGVLCGAYPVLFMASFFAWVLIFVSTRLVSLSSLGSMAFLFILSLFLLTDRRPTVVLGLLFLLICWSHRSNIKRLINGQEFEIAKKNDNKP